MLRYTMQHRRRPSPLRRAVLVSGWLAGLGVFVLLALGDIDFVSVPAGAARGAIAASHRGPAVVASPGTTGEPPSGVQAAAMAEGRAGNLGDAPMAPPAGSPNTAGPGLPSAAAPAALTTSATTAPSATPNGAAMSASTIPGPGAKPGAPAPRASGPGSMSVLHAGPSGRSIFVYRPAVADSSALPVVYFLHGVPGQPGDIFGAGLAAFLDRVFEQGAAPFVVAAPDGNGANHADTEWADAEDGSDSVESFFMYDALRAVEGFYPRDSAHRAIAGDSMGGYAAMNLAQRHPGVFSQVVSMAGYFRVDDPSGMFGGHSGAIAANTPDQHVQAVRGLHILLLDGMQESDPVIRGESERFAGLLSQAGIPFTIHLAPGDDSWQYAASQFTLITAFLDGGFPG